MAYTKTNWVNGETPINATNLNKIENQLEALTNMIYPVGSIYLSVNNTSPATLFGGTWEQIKDTFLLSAGDTYTAGDTGGEATHTLTIDEIPSHQHSTIDICSYSGGSANARTGYGYEEVALNKSSYGNGVSATGGGQAHNNMPPYLTVYMWKRTA